MILEYVGDCVDLSVSEVGRESLKHINDEGNHVLEDHALHDVLLEIDLHRVLFLDISLVRFISISCLRIILRSKRMEVRKSKYTYSTGAASNSSIGILNSLLCERAARISSGWQFTDNYTSELIIISHSLAFNFDPESDKNDIKLFKLIVDSV